VELIILKKEEGFSNLAPYLQGKTEGIMFKEDVP